MTSLSDYLENTWLNLAFSQTAWPSKPTTLYFGLLTSAPTDAGGGTEISGGGYARSSVGASNNTNFTVTANAVANATVINFPMATADQGLATHWGIYDASSGGNLLFWGALGAAKNILLGDTMSVAIGAFTLTVGGAVGAKLANDLLLHTFNNTAMPALATVYIGLGTAADGSSITGEGASNGYARIGVTNNASNFPPASAGQKSNGPDIAFAAASGSWGGPFTAFIIANHLTTASSATILWFGNLDAARTPANTDAPTFLAGDLKLTLD